MRPILYKNFQKIKAHNNAQQEGMINTLITTTAQAFVEVAPHTYLGLHWQKLITNTAYLPSTAQNAIKKAPFSHNYGLG